MSPVGHRDTRGFTLVEVLVTMVIICFGMLGLAGLILKGHQASSEAYQRNQALILANDIAEKMRANRLPSGQINSSVYKVLPAAALGAAYIPIAPASDCSITNCTQAQIATYDLNTWNNLLFGEQETSTTASQANVGGLANARGCIEPSGANGQVVVSVAWEGIQSTAAPAPTASTCGSTVYTSATNRRLVYIDVQ
jgi:type IV pilus assembly protein PilV